MHGLDYFCEVNNIKLGDIAKYLGVSKQAPTNWKSGTKNFPDKYKRSLYELFKIPEDKQYLLEVKNLDRVQRVEIELIHAKQITDANIDFLNRKLKMTKVLINIENELLSLINDNKVELFETKLNKIKDILQ